MAELFFDIPLPFECDMRELVIAGRQPEKLSHLPFDKSTIHPALQRFLSSRGVRVSHAEVFYTPPRNLLGVHLDGSAPSDLAKLNFVYGGKGSRMMWWKLKPGVELVEYPTPVGTTYLSTRPSDCIMIGSHVVSTTLVQVGVLHSVMNAGNEGRWCLSLVMADAQGDLSFAEAKAKLTRAA